jgi:hypothetical protein
MPGEAFLALVGESDAALAGCYLAWQLLVHGAKGGDNCVDGHSPQCPDRKTGRTHRHRDSYPAQELAHAGDVNLRVVNGRADASHRDTYG